MKNVLLLLLIVPTLVFSQGFSKEKMLKSLKADKIEMDNGNGDGVFKARNKKTKKWGMYQWMGKGAKVNELIPMDYDSVRYIPFNGSFTAVYNDGKVGFYLAAWSYDEPKQTVACLYDDYQRYNVENQTYLAVSKEGKWGWVNWLTGEEMTEFESETSKDLPYPNYEQNSYE